MRSLRGFVRLCAVLGGVTLLASYLGAIHPLGDSLAVFRLWIAGGVALCGLCFLFLSQRRAALFALAAAAFAAGPIVAMVYKPVTERPDASVTIYAKNTLGHLGDLPAIAADIEAAAADIVFLQELTRADSDYEGALAQTHPYAHRCPFSDWSAVAVISRWPITETYCSPHRSFAAARIEAPGGPIWSVSTHLVWPYPHGQMQHLEEALPFLEGLEGRVIVAGDFNMVPWGHSVRRIERATGTRRIGPLMTTLEWRVPLQIDHVLTDGMGEVELRPRLGADHYGLVARIQWP